MTGSCHTLLNRWCRTQRGRIEYLLSEKSAAEWALNPPIEGYRKAFQMLYIGGVVSHIEKRY